MDRRGDGAPVGEGASGDGILLLHVDDSPGFTEMASKHLERASERLAVETANSAADGLEVLAERPVDCVVSDYEMPDMDGLEFLAAVREDHPDLPFILFTGRGSEEIASRAVSAGVTDYLQKGRGTDRYAVLANRVENAVDRFRSERALAASERRLSLFVDQSPLGVVEWNTEFEVVSLNPAAEEILGYEEAELRGRSWEAIVPERDRAAVGEVVDELLADRGGYRSVNENVTASGDRIICEWHNRVVTDDDGDVVAVFSQFQDVTEREEDKRRLETLMSNLPGMVYRCRNEPDWPMEFVGGECEALTGYPAGALEADEVLWGEEVLHPDDRERAWAVVQDALADDDPFELEYRIRTADGETRWVWERGRGVDGPEGDLEALEGFITDVTERVEREREFSKSNTVLTTLLEHLPVGVLVEDSDREVIAANRRLCDAIGVAVGPEEFVGADCAAALEDAKRHFVDPERFVERTEALLDGRDPVDGEEFVTTDGRTLERSYVPYSLPDGEANLWLYRDVTERVERERELEDENERLDAFAEVVSHDLRNPLNVATGNIALAREDHDDERLAEAAASLERMDALVDDLLSVAREGDPPGEREPVDVGAVAEDCAGRVDAGDAAVDVDATVTVRADRGRLAQVFENLLRNAVEHGGDGVTVTVGDLEDGAGFYVADDGPGIPAEERDRVFEAGYTTADAGAGLGLSIVRDVAEAHGWSVRVTESEAGGTRVEFRTDDV